MLIYNPIDTVMPESSAGLFSFYIPLIFIFDFCEDYDKVIPHEKHQLIMTRDFTGNYALFKSRFYSVLANRYNGKVDI